MTTNSATHRSATAVAHPNIAFIKYWGNLDDRLRLPVNPSLSMNLAGLFTRTTVTWDASLDTDQLYLNRQQQTGIPQQRVSKYLDAIRPYLNIQSPARVVSANNFPIGVGIASSASAFAALAVAAAAAAGKTLSERELSILARLGSGSASRSVPGGFVEWHISTAHEGSFAASIAPADWWELVDLIAVVDTTHKAVGSTEGHQSAKTSDLQNARVAGAYERLRRCKHAILERDFASLAEVVEYDSNLMHAVMMTSQPPLFYWLPGTLRVMQAVRNLRAQGCQVCYTLDAGPNIHCICVREDAEHVRMLLQSLSEVRDILEAGPGGPATVVEDAT